MCVYMHVYVCVHVYCCSCVYITSMESRFFHWCTLNIALRNQGHGDTTLFAHTKTHVNHTVTHTHTHVHSLTHSHTHVHSLTHTHTHVYSLSHTHTHVYSLTHTHMCTHSHRPATASAADGESVEPTLGLGRISQWFVGSSDW